MLGIVSGAFGAFRAVQLKRIMGWDVGHGEDSDLTLRLRKSGFQVAFAPYAQCFTNVPTRWTKLFKQRRRWTRGVIRHKTRKHIDMAYFWSPSFQWGNFFHLIDAWVFRVGCLFAIWGFTLMTILHPPKGLAACDIRAVPALRGFPIVQVLPILFFSLDRRRDARILLVLPLWRHATSCSCAARGPCSILEEIFFATRTRITFIPSTSAMRPGIGENGYQAESRAEPATKPMRASFSTEVVFHVVVTCHQSTKNVE